MKKMPAAVTGFVRDEGVCRVASVQPDGSPHLAPVCHVFDGKVAYIDVSNVGGTAAAFRSGSGITLLIDHYEDDWGKLRGVLLFTRGEALEGERKDAAWRMIREKFPQSKDVGWNPRLTLALHIDDWKAWGFGE